MKTLKLTLVATLVAFLMVSVANADGIKEKRTLIKCVNITVAQAMNDPGLLAAMTAQVSPEILHFPLPPIIVEVKYNGAIYRIIGSRSDWMRFFTLLGIPPAHKTKKAVEE